MLIAPHWVQKISWFESLVYLDMTKEAIKTSPQWSPQEPISREYEAGLYDYYGQPKYWTPE